MSQYNQLVANSDELSMISNSLFFYSDNNVDVSEYNSAITLMSNLIEDAKDSCSSSLDDDQFYCCFSDEVIEKSSILIEDLEKKLEMLDSFWYCFEKKKNEISNVPSLITEDFISSFMLNNKV